MNRVVSVSRRTDIPAFYGPWFMKRIEEGFAGWTNPFGGQRQVVSLRREEVPCLAFWSKNYRPFLPVLRELKARGYPCFFNYTITGLPSVFECNLVPADDAVDSLREIAALFSPEHINWRYDPIIVSDLTPAGWHVARFAALCRMLHGHTARCYVSFAARYAKVERNFARFEREQGVRIANPPAAERLQLAGRLAGEAQARGMTLHSCCGDDLVGGGIAKAHCLDAEVIARLHPAAAVTRARRPTRRACGCAESVDIGAYDTCPHGCIYCYANVNKTRAAASHAAHDPASAFL